MKRNKVTKCTLRFKVVEDGDQQGSLKEATCEARPGHVIHRNVGWTRNGGWHYDFRCSCGWTKDDWYSKSNEQAEHHIDRVDEVAEEDTSGKPKKTRLTVREAYEQEKCQICHQPMRQNSIATYRVQENMHGVHVVASNERFYGLHRLPKARFCKACAEKEAVRRNNAR